MDIDNTSHTTQKSPIDVEKILRLLWEKRLRYVKILPIVLVCTYAITVCFPRYYSCTMELAPESGGTGASGSLSSLASSFGLDGLSKLGGSEDAISPLLYPDLLKSDNFIIKLFPLQVKSKDGSINTTYYDYIAKHQDSPFWMKHIINPFLNLFEAKETKTFTGKEIVKVRSLTKKQQNVINSISGNIVCKIDKKTNAITISVEDQDPEICATIGEAVLENIQTFIIDYRTSKARNDYEYYKKLRNEAKKEYEKARQRYAAFSDANVDVSLQSVHSKIDDLENDMQLRYNAYSAIATQTQAAQGKIQENTPVFTPIQTAKVPIKPAGPKRTLISLAVTMLAAVLISLQILYSSKE